MVSTLRSAGFMCVSRHFELVAKASHLASQAPSDEPQSPFLAKCHTAAAAAAPCATTAALINRSNSEQEASILLGLSSGESSVNFLASIAASHTDATAETEGETVIPHSAMI